MKKANDVNMQDNLILYFNTKAIEIFEFIKEPDGLINHRLFIPIQE
jgi:hypothetical protein